jgi:ribosomal protein L12E/L44/L45/RPP1/RPP2
VPSLGRLLVLASSRALSSPPAPPAVAPPLSTITTGSTEQGQQQEEEEEEQEKEEEEEQGMDLEQTSSGKGDGDKGERGGKQGLRCVHGVEAARGWLSLLLKMLRAAARPSLPSAGAGSKGATGSESVDRDRELVLQAQAEKRAQQEQQEREEQCGSLEFILQSVLSLSGNSTVADLLLHHIHRRCERMHTKQLRQAPSLSTGDDASEREELSVRWHDAMIILVLLRSSSPITAALSHATGHRWPSPPPFNSC